MESAATAAAPDRPRFSLTQLLVATTAIAIYLGLLRSVGVLAFYFAAACWVLLLVKQLDPASRAAARIAAFVWGGVVVPLTVLILPMQWGSMRGDASRVFTHLYVHWITAVAVAVISWLVVRPRLQSFASGYLALASTTIFIYGSGLPVICLRIPNVDVATFADNVFVFVQVIAGMSGGFIAGITFLALAVLAWRGARERRGASWGFFLLGFFAAYFGVQWIVRLLI